MSGARRASPVPADLTIERVPRRRTCEALRFLLGGSRADFAVAARVESFRHFLRKAGGRHWFHRARRDGRDVAAAIVVACPGRVGMGFYSASDLPGVALDALAPVLGGAADEALSAGVAFVQTLIPPSRSVELPALAEAGFQPLAELVYLHHDLRLEPPRSTARPTPVTWRTADLLGPDALASLIAATYERSRDCPGLIGLRTPAETLASHEASGVYHPKSWWIVEVDGAPAGCILLNDSARQPDCAELVYLGVAGRYRGLGLGRRMLGEAIAWARRTGRQGVEVAVDSANDYAMELYLQAGFVERSRRLAWIAKPPGLHKGAP